VFDIDQRLSVPGTKPELPIRTVLSLDPEIETIPVHLFEMDTAILRYDLVNALISIASNDNGWVCHLSILPLIWCGVRPIPAQQNR
jgi:hypothetical protein